MKSSASQDLYLLCWRSLPIDEAIRCYAFQTKLPHLPLGRQRVHLKSVNPGPLVLGTRLRTDNTPVVERDRTVSRRSKPSSRTTLNGEQPYPWDRLQPQDVMSRHRGAKLPRRYELLGGISLLSPEYLLSVERWPFHTEPPDHYILLSHQLETSLSLSSMLVLLHSTYGYQAY